MSEKRLETFVFEFENQEIFKKFWGEYCHLDPELNNGIKWKAVAVGDKIEECEKLLALIGELYDIATNRFYRNKDKRDKILEEVEKLLGIIN
jgi:hypothetical protein